MAYPVSQLVTVVTGQTLTAALWNNEFQNGYTNVGVPSNIDDASSNLAAMQATVDPYPASAESLATDLAGELQRLRYVAKTNLGLSQWYHDVTTPYETFLANINGYRRPTLTWISATLVDVENNTGTSNETKIIFPDGTARSVTEDTSSTTKYRRFDITATANFTSGTEDSGMRSGESEATNTWYAIYAVKSQIDSTKFVLVGSTTLPLQANFSTLNTNFGANSWVYLGLIRNGDRGGATGDILAFSQMGNLTTFNNTLAGGSTSTGAPMSGILLANTAGAATLTYTHATGTGSAQIPGNIAGCVYGWAAASVAATVVVSDSGDVRNYARVPSNSTLVMGQSPRSASEGVQLRNTAASSIAYDITLYGFFDRVLGVGPNPVL